MQLRNFWSLGPISQKWNSLYVVQTIYLQFAGRCKPYLEANQTMLRIKKNIVSLFFMLNVSFQSHQEHPPYWLKLDDVYILSSKEDGNFA